MKRSFLAAPFRSSAPAGLEASQRIRTIEMLRAHLTGNLTKPDSATARPLSDLHVRYGSEASQHPTEIGAYDELQNN